jgi:hypothetical protein
MVKLQTKTIRKHYGRGKGEYSYQKHMLPFPIRENPALEPFLKKDLQFEMNVRDGAIYIALKNPKEKT